MADENKSTNEERDALLVEYQVCERDNAANFQGYWTLAGIFIGISPVLLGGLVFAVIANDSLLNILLCQNEPLKTWVVGTIAIVLGAAMIVILKKLRGWHERILQNQRINSGRMREIELELGMSRSWRTFALDRWYDLLKKDRNVETKCDPQKWDDLKKVLQKCLYRKYHDKLENLKDSILQLIKQYPKKNGKFRYVRPSSEKHYPCILCTLISLWVLVVAVAVFLIIAALFCWQGRLVASGVILVGSVIYICIKKCKHKQRSINLESKTI